MRKVHFATTNRGKYLLISSDLARFGIEVVHESMDLSEPRSDDLNEIANHKVMAAWNILRKPVIALDAGFFVNSLNGFPRTYVNHVLRTIGVHGILKLAEDLPRDCYFQNSIAYYDGTTEKPLFFESVTKGKLSPEPRGEQREYSWSDLFFIFIPEGHEKTLAEMQPEEFHSWRDKNELRSSTANFAKWLAEKN